jgi:heme oxygenase (biliverdin-IX-beta and delta-forming)
MIAGMNALHRDVASLIREERWAALATQKVTLMGGRLPRASMAAYAVAPDGRILLFVSGLAEHARGLLASSQASMAISRPDRGEGDPHLLARVSLSGEVMPVARGSEEFAALGALYTQRFPDAATRFELGDFILFTFVPKEVRYVGGFANASTLEWKDVVAALALPAA